MDDSPALRRIKALERALRTTGLRTSSTDATLKLQPGRSETQDVDNLGGLELIYCFCKSVFKDVIGDPKSAFAAFDESSGALQVFTSAEQFVNIDKFPWLQAKYGALEAVQREGASFHVCDGQVTCVSNGVTAHGSDYAEAAMRCWLKESAETR